MTSPVLPNKYIGPDVYLVGRVVRNRRPTLADYKQPETGRNYALMTGWQVGKNPTTGVEGELWYLSKIVANQGYWVRLNSGGGGPLVEVDVDFVTAPGVDPVTPDANGLMTISGNVVPNGTNANAPVASHTRALNTFQMDVQLAAAVPATPADPFDVGMCSFDDSQFSVDGNGFVQLIGGDAAIDAINVDASTPPGTNPVVPDGAGEITVTGAQAPANTTANVIYTNSTAANEYAITIQQADVSAAKDTTLNGVAHFNSAQFSIDQGFVSYLGGASPVYGGVSNLGIGYSGGTFTVFAADGTALSAANPAYVWLNDRNTPGQLVRYTITANQTFTDGAGGTIDNQRFGVTTGVNWAVDMPFFLYAVGNDAQDTINFMISRGPSYTASPIAANIGKTGAIVNNGYTDFFSLGNVTVADYDDNPCICVGSFRMQFAGATDSYTVQALADYDGIGQYQEGTTFTMPAGQNGAAAGTYFVANAGTEPQFATNGMVYRILRSGYIRYQFNGQVCNVAGVGANTLQPILPSPILAGTVQESSNFGLWFDAGTSTYNQVLAQGLTGTAYMNQIFTDGSAAAFQNATIQVNDALEIDFEYYSYGN